MSAPVSFLGLGHPGKGRGWGVEMLQVAACYRIPRDKLWHHSHWARMQTFPLFFFNKNALKLP